MKRISTLALFHKVVRKYWKRHARKEHYTWHGHSVTNYWTDNIWCYYIIDDPSELDTALAKRYLSWDVDLDRYPEWITEWKALLGKKVQLSWGNIEPKEGIFYIALQNNGAAIGLSCEDGFYFYPFCYNIKKIDL